MQDNQDDDDSVKLDSESKETKYLSWINLKPEVFQQRRALAEKRLKETQSQDIRNNQQLRKLIDEDHEIVRYHKDIDFTLSTYEVSNLFAYRVIWYNDDRFRNEIVSFPHFYLQAWQNDLPVLVTIDSLLYPFHQSFERIIEYLQNQVLSPMIEQLLIKLICNCSKKREENEKYIDALQYFIVCLYVLQAPNKQLFFQTFNEDKLIEFINSNFPKDEEIFYTKNCISIIKKLRDSFTSYQAVFEVNFFCQIYQLRNSTRILDFKNKTLNLTEEDQLNLRYQRCMNFLSNIPIDVTDNPQTIFSLAYIVNEDLETKHLYEVIVQFFSKIYNINTQIDLMEVLEISHQFQADDNITISFVDYKNLIIQIKKRLLTKNFILPLDNPDQLEFYQYMSFFPRHIQLDEEIKEKMTGIFLETKQRFQISIFQLIYSMYNNQNLNQQIKKQMKGSNDDRIQYRDGVNLMKQLEDLRAQISQSMVENANQWRKSCYLLWHFMMAQLSDSNNYQTYGESLSPFKSKFWIDKNLKLQISALAQAKQTFRNSSEKVKMDPQSCGFREVLLESNHAFYQEMKNFSLLFRQAYEDLVEDHHNYFKNKSQNFFGGKSFMYLQEVLIVKTEEESKSEVLRALGFGSQNIRELEKQLQGQGVPKIRDPHFEQIMHKKEEFQCILKMETAASNMEKISESLIKNEKLEEGDQMFLQQLIYGSIDSYQGISFDGWYSRMFYHGDATSIFKSYSRITQVLDFPPRKAYNYKGVKTYIAEKQPRIGLVNVNGKAFLFATTNPSQISLRDDSEDFIDFKEWQESLNYICPTPNTSQVIKDFVHGTSQYNTSSDTTVVEHTDLEDLIQQINNQSQNQKESEMEQLSIID